MPSLFRKVKQLSPHDFRLLEEQLEIERPGAKKAVVEEMITRHYDYPEAIVE